jgi:hypothetical protein
MRSALQRLARDEHGQGETVSFTLAQIPFWVLVAILVAVTMLGLRRASAVLAVHEAGLASGRSDQAAGAQTAEHVLDVWWGGDAATVTLAENEQQRSVQVWLDDDWDTAAGRFIGSLSIEASSWGRKEGFYAGPPEPGGFE